MTSFIMDARQLDKAFIADNASDEFAFFEGLSLAVNSIIT